MFYKFLAKNTKKCNKVELNINSLIEIIFELT